MQRYGDQEKAQLEVKCNQCGRNVFVQKDILKEDVFHVEKVWGYFSKKDGKKHTWDLCEECYEKLVKGFAIPLDEMDVTELL